MAGPDLSVLSTAVDMSTIVVALGAVFGAWCAVELARVAARMVVAAVRGADSDRGGFDGTTDDDPFAENTAKQLEDWKRVRG